MATESNSHTMISYFINFYCIIATSIIVYSSTSSLEQPDPYEAPDPFEAPERPDPFEAPELPEAPEAPELPDHVKYGVLRGDPASIKVMQSYRDAHRAAMAAYRASPFYRAFNRAYGGVQQRPSHHTARPAKPVQNTVTKVVHPHRRTG